MKIKDQKEYDDWKAENSDDPYGLRCFTYAEDWADMMEEAMAEGKKLEDVADKLSHKADTDGITGFMYGMAMQILALCWEHGEALRRWHNLKTQIRDEGEKANEKGTTLNPALLCMEKK